MKRIIMMMILLVAIPSYAGAHSHLESSVPAEGEVVENEFEQVELTFSAGIEDGSVMTLESEGETFEFADLTVRDNVMTGAVPEELPDGSYVVDWTVSSEDGHPLEGEYAFELQRGSEEAAESSEEEFVSPFDNASADQDSAGFSPFVVIIPILIAALIGGFFVIRRNR